MELAANTLITNTRLERTELQLGQVWWLTPVIPALWETKARRSLEPRSSRLVLSKKTKTSFLQKNKYKFSQALWCKPVVSATQEAAVGGSVEPGEVKISVNYDCTTALQPG